MDFYDLTWKDVATVAFVVVALYIICVVGLCL
jgi:hypothetical protein